MMVVSMGTGTTLVKYDNGDISHVGGLGMGGGTLSGLARIMLGTDDIQHISELAKAGKAVIVISSEMPGIIGTCERTYVINDGQIAGELSKEELTQEKIMQCVMAHNRKGDRNE